MKKIFFSLLFLIVITNAAKSAVYVNNLWKTKDVIVCFSDFSDGARLSQGTKKWSKFYKNKVRKYVESEYSREKTAISFYGFKDCEDTINPDVIVYLEGAPKYLDMFITDKRGHASVGTRGSIINKTYPSATTFAKFRKSGMNKTTIIHEFGHILGLAHEHYHVDAKKKQPFCRFTSKKYNEKRKNYEYTEFDRKSIMNYCGKINSLFKRHGLSKGDINTLVDLYNDVDEESGYERNEEEYNKIFEILELIDEEIDNGLQENLEEDSFEEI